MRAARALYFTYYAALAALLPYLALYYQSAGLTGPQIGLLSGLMPLLGLIGAPLWAEFADATGRYRLVLATSLGATIVFVLGLSLAASFVPMAVLVVLFALAIAPVMPLVDHSVVEALGERAHEYGRQRIWGAYGWGITAPIVGWTTDRLGLGWIFPIYAVVMIAALVVTLRLPVPTAVAGHRFGAGLASMLRDTRWFGFLGTVFVSGICSSLVLTFLPLYWRALGGDLTLIGLGVTTAAISELPVLAFGGALLLRIGARRILIAASLAWAVRLALYPLIAEPLWIAPVQLLHGPTFAAVWIAGVAYANHLAPRGAGGAAQGLFTGVSIGLGGFAGAILGGIAFEALGAQGMFGAGAALALAAAALMALSTRSDPSDDRNGRTRHGPHDVDATRT